MMYTSLKPIEVGLRNVPLKRLNEPARVTAKVKFLLRKIKMGHEVSLFQKRGNGIKTLIKSVGRLNDLSGLFVITSGSGEPLILGSSHHVLMEIQKLARAKRKKDRIALEKVAKFYGFKNYKMGRELLLATYVNWIEITDKSFRLNIKRAMRSQTKFVL